MTGAQYVIKFISEKNADTVFGYPGAAVLELYDEIAKSGLRHILVRHEQGAVHAAAGYAKASGKPGICIATSGPGAANLVTGIADAYLDSTPMIIITGQVDTAQIGRDAFQEADILGITMPVTKHSYLVRKASALKKSLLEAWNIATTGRTGPVLIDIAHDVFVSRIDANSNEEIVLPRKRVNEFPFSASLDRITEAVSNSYRPLILAGGGVVCGHASEALSRFAAQSHIPVATTLPGMGISIPPALKENVTILGMAGIYGSEAANAALAQCDLLIAVGTRMSDRTIGGYLAASDCGANKNIFRLFEESHCIVHCDIDPAEINKNVKAYAGVVCEAREFFDTLTEKKIPLHTDALNSWDAILQQKNHKPPLAPSDNFLSCREILRTIDMLEGERRDAVYVTDVGNHQMCAAREIAPIYERGFITSAGLGVMGFGLPAAIGASFSVGKDVKNIILLCGDGGLQMTVEELSTLHSAKLPVKIFLFDNGSLGMICRMQDERFSSVHSQSVLKFNPDFELLAKAYGIEAHRLDISSRPNLTEEINRILSSENNILVHCVTG